MIDICKVLEILNSGKYEKIEEYSSRVCSALGYTLTLKEGGIIEITQVITSGISYRISLFIPNEKRCIKSWTFEHRISCSRTTSKDPLYSEISAAFNNLYDEYSKKRTDEYSKYFPQEMFSK